MFLRFSEDSQKLLLLSLKEKNGLNDYNIGTEHIFLAALSMKKSHICNILNEHNIFYDKFKTYLNKNNSNENINYFIFSPAVKNIFNNLSNSKSDISPFDIISAILNNNNSKVNLILRKMNIDIKSILKAINSNSKKKRSIKKSLLSEIGINLNEKCCNSDEIVIGRDKELDMIIEILCCKNKNNPILIGEAGVGKTAIIEELARRIASCNIPLKLKNKKIYSVAMSSLVAGTKYRGEFEEKINKLIIEVENNEDVILFIDEIHTLVGAGGADGAIDASNILKPALARGNIKIIGATTSDEYKKFFSGDKALNRRFKTVFIEEPNVYKTKEILLGIKKIYEDFHRVIIPDSIIEKIIFLADKYIEDKKFPDKAIDILDETCVLTSFSLNKSYNSITNLDREINKLIELKNKSLMLGDYKTAMKYSYDEKNLQSKLGKIQMNLIKNKKQIIVNEEMLLKVMERKTKIPFYTYKYDYKKILKLCIEYKKKTIFNEDLIDDVNNITLDIYANLVNNGLGNYLYVTSDNYNKNDYFINDYINTFFSSANHLNIDINNYKNIDDLLRESDFYLKKDTFMSKVKMNPFSIIIVDNFEQADTSIKKFFINISKCGYYLNRDNEKIDFSHVLFIYSMLSTNKGIGFSTNKQKNSNRFIIDISSISVNGLKKKIIKLCQNNNYSYKKEIINHIINNVMDNYDNLGNLEYFIRKEILNFNSKLDRKRTIKV